MKTFRGPHHPNRAPRCALTIGNFDGVHRGHQAMLARLRAAAATRGLPTCVLTFEPHPRDYFAALRGDPDLAPTRISTFRDKLTQIAAAGIDQTVVLPFNAVLAQRAPRDFVRDILLAGLGARYVLVGDDFRFGARRAGDYALLAALGREHGFEVAQMDSYEVEGTRASSSAVRAALAEGRLRDAAALLGRPYAISGHVVRGRRLGRQLAETAPGAGDGFRTLNLRFCSHAHAWKPATSGIFVARVFGLDAVAIDGVANLGVRPTLDPHDANGGRVLLETHCLRWPAHLGPEGAYGKIIRVELLHKLHDEKRYASLAALTAGIRRDCDAARNWLTAHSAHPARI